MSRHLTRYLPLALAGALACNKPAPTKNCEEFEAAMAQLDEVSQASLDPTLGDPRFGPVLTALEAVGPECKQHAEAQATANTIRAAMAKQRAAPPPPAVVVTPPPFSPEEEAKAIAEYLKAYDAADSATNQAKLRGEIRDSKSLDPVIDECERAKRLLQGLSPPRACDELHRASGDVIDSTLDLARDMQRAIDAKDKAFFRTVQARSAALMEELNKVKALRFKACKSG